MEMNLPEFLRMYLLTGASAVLSARFIWKVKFTLRDGICFVFIWPIFLFYAVGIRFYLPKFVKKHIDKRGIVTPEAKQRLQAMHDFEAHKN